MELTQLENIWKSYDKKITDNTRINKEILRRILISKPENRLSWVKIKAGFNILSPVIFITLILVLDVQFHFKTNFYIGLTLFLPIYLMTYIWDIKYFRLIRNIDFTMSVLSIKKSIVELEKYKIKTTRIKYILMPVAMIGFILMIAQKITFKFDFVSIIPLLLIILVFILTYYFTFKYLISGQFKMLNNEIDEILMLEKE